MAVVDRHVVRPKPGKLIGFLLLSLMFVALSVWLVLAGSVIAVVAGILAIAFFGGGLILVVVLAFRRGGLSQLTLTPTGIETAEGATVPWSDVEEVGATSGSGKMVWLLLNSYNRYAASMTARSRREAGWKIRFMKPFAHLLRFLPLMRRYADRVRNPEDELAWNREHFGYDIGISTAWLDRSPEEFVELLERYRREATGAQ
jgi:hypothetical protein